MSERAGIKYTALDAHYSNTIEFKRAMDNSYENIRERDSLGDHTILITRFPSNSFGDGNDPDYYYNTFQDLAKSSSSRTYTLSSLQRLANYMK